MTLQNTVVTGGIPEGFVRLPAVHATGGAWFMMPDLIPKNFGFDIVAMIPVDIPPDDNPNVFGGAIGDEESWNAAYLSLIESPRRWVWTAEEKWTDTLQENTRVPFPENETLRIVLCSVRRFGQRISYTDTITRRSQIVQTDAEPVGAKWAFCTFVDYDGIPRESPSEHFAGWIYSAAFYRGNQVYRDLVPVKKAATGEVGFFDTMSRHFFTSEGAARFSEN